MPKETKVTCGFEEESKFEQGEIAVTVLTGRPVQIIDILSNTSIQGYLKGYWVRFEDYSFKKLAEFELQKW